MAVTNPFLSAISGCEYSFTASVNGTAIPSGKRRAFTTTSYVPTSGAAGRIERLYLLEGQTLAAGANTVLDLTTAFPSSLTGIKYVGVVITGTTGQLQVGGTTTNGHPLWFANPSDGWVIYPGGPQFSQGHPTDYSVVDATHKRIYIANAHPTDAVTYRVIVGGKDT